MLWVANLRQLKRPDRFLRAWPRRCRASAFTWSVVPFPGEESLLPPDRSHARMVPNLTFHGKVPYLEIGHLFDRARLLANTSEIEGFPNTFLQAWVRGIPVVTMFDPDRLLRVRPWFVARNCCRHGPRY